MKVADQGDVVYEDGDCVIRVRKGKTEDMGIIVPYAAVYVNKKTPRGEEVVSRRPTVGGNYLLWNYRVAT